MNRNPVGWFEIYVKDIDKATAFYEAVLATKLSPLETPEPSVFRMMTFPMEQNAPGAAGALITMKGEQPSGNGVLIYFSCEDCAVEAKRAPENGGSIMKEKFSIGPYGFISLIVDLDGNVIGLHSMK